MVAIASAVLGAVGYVIAPGLLRLMGVEPEVFTGALPFMRVSFIGLVTVFGFSMFQAVLRGVGEVTLPLYIVLGTVILNFILDPLFIFGWGPIPAEGVAGAAYATLPASVDVDTVTKGTGESPTRDDIALVNYKGMLPGGKVFDEGKQAVLPLSEVVPGFTKALEQMQRGGKYKVHIPAKLAYGEKGAGPIPPNTDLDFDIELLDFKSRAEVEQQQRILQQLQQMQMGGAAAGVPGAPGAGVPQGVPPQQ